METRVVDRRSNDILEDFQSNIEFEKTLETVLPAKPSRSEWLKKNPTWIETKYEDLVHGDLIPLGGDFFRVISNEPNELGGRVVNVLPRDRDTNILSTLIFRSKDSLMIMRRRKD